MKKKKRIIRTIISTMLMCCMLVGDLGSVFATSVGSSVVSEQQSEEQGSTKDVQTLAEPVEEPDLGIQSEQSSSVPEVPVVEEPKVEVEPEVKPEVETPVETPEVKPEVVPEPTPEVEQELEVKPEPEKPVEKPEVKPELEEKPEEKPSANVPSKQPEADVPTEEPVEPSVEATIPSETDNWSLDLVFYDSTVDGGKTPLKSIDWDASDGGYGKGESRTITVQINYKNANAVRTYQPGEVEISIPNMMYNCNKANFTIFNVSLNCSANDSTHSGYDWNLVGSTDNWLTSISTIDFTNSIVFEQGSNFEGSLQLKYNISFNAESDSHIESSLDDYCIQSHVGVLGAKLQANSNTISSNSVNYSMSRRYEHPWNYLNASHSHTNINSVKSYDGLENASNFYWITLNIETTNVYKNDYPNVRLDWDKSYFFVDLPESCVVYDANLNKCQYSENHFMVTVKDTKYDSYVGRSKLIIGFPKSEYSDDTSVIVSTELYGAYKYSADYKVWDRQSSSINLLDYVYNPGELYGFSKNADSFYNHTLRYQDIKGKYDVSLGNVNEFDLSPSVIYTGNKYTLKYGDDLLFYETGGVSGRLLDTEYRMEKITFGSIHNGQDVLIPYGKYECELWVRYSGEENYTLLDSFTNGSIDTWYLTEPDKNTVGYYFLVKDVTESISRIAYSSVRIRFLKDNIEETGRFYNYGFSQVFFEDDNGELVLQNPSKEENYESYFCKDVVLSNDLSLYNSCIQRDYCSVFWKYYNIQKSSKLKCGSENYKVVQDIGNEEFNCKFDVGFGFKPIYEKYYNDIYLNDIEREYWYTGGIFYDLLPEGFELLSSENSILNSIQVGTVNKYGDVNKFITEKIQVFNKNKKKISEDELQSLIKANSSIIITNNWNNSGRVLIKIILNLKENPIIGITEDTFSKESFFGLSASYNCSLSYDYFIANGNNYNHRCFVEPIDRNLKVYPYSPTTEDSNDLNENGIIKEVFNYRDNNIVIDSIISTHQDVQTSVQTDKSNYSTGLVKASPESEYSYKLRARSGSNQVSNLVLVNNLEEGYGDNEHWKGEFLGIDTSFAENRTYRVYKPSDPRADAEGYVQEKVKVKPYYSTSTTEGELYQTEEKVITDSSGEQIVQRVRVVDEHGNFVKNSNWLEYSDSVDKGTVKSLAFEFLDVETGEQAILPENNLIYVEVKMRAPVEADGLTADGKAKYAYNNCFTQWNALDSMGQAVDFITGINSNTVKVTVNDRVSVQINKVWEDEENKYNTRPDTVDFIMKKDGKEVDRQTLEKGKSTVTFSGLLVDELSTYTFEEVCPSGYTTEGVIYDKVSDTYTATNTLDPSSLVEVKGTKTWVGDLESERPESITVNLYRNDKKIDSKVVRASDGWSYDFGKFVKNDPDGNEYNYRVEEESIEGYKASYATIGNGLKITFNKQCKTESASYDYVEIYYKGNDDKTYKLGKWGNTDLAGRVVGVPSKDFWLYWRTDSSNSNYYGFSIDSIKSANVKATGTVATLPNYVVEEVSGSTYPDSAFDDHTHGNYGNNVNKIWHYTSSIDDFNITNTSNMIDIEGTKYWSGEGLKPASSKEILDSMRPASITVNLLQDGKQFASTTTDESKEWRYSFRVPKLDENGREYVYTVREAPVEGYIDSYYDGNGSRITFSNDSRTESVSYDYVEIYYKKDGKTYKAGRWGGTTIAGASVTIPAKNFYLYWKTNSSGNNYYGYSVDSVVGVECSEVVGTVATLPDMMEVDTSSVEDLQSKHAPYLDNDKKLFKYWGNWLSRYDIENTLNLTEISGTKHWKGDTEDMRPASITVNLLQDGVKIDSKTTDASKGWQYSFTAPKFDDTGRDYEYKVTEEPVEGYRTYYAKDSGCRIHFSILSRTEGKNIDYVKIYYEYEGEIYSTSRLGGSMISGKTVDIPSSEFYVYWKTDGSVNDYYGYKIDSVERIEMDIPYGGDIREGALPCSFREVEDISNLQSSHSPYDNNVKELLKYKLDNGDLYDITNTLDNIELRFMKLFNSGTDSSVTGLQHDGISFTLYENTLQDGYPEAFPGTSDEWRKIGELNKYEVGGRYPNEFITEYHIDGLKSNKEYFLVENVNNLVVKFYDPNNKGYTKDYNVDVASIKDSCYVVKTGTGTVDNISLTVYGYKHDGVYTPGYFKDDAYGFCEYYGGYKEGTNLHSFLEGISRRYPNIESYDLINFIFPLIDVYDSGWVIQNFLECNKIGVTKKIKASDINFDNGNPTFIFEARADIRRADISPDSKSVEANLYSIPILDIKHVEFTKEYVEANTDPEGYVSKTVYFDRMYTDFRDEILISERVSSRYGCSSVSVDGFSDSISGVEECGGLALIPSNNPFFEVNITFTNEKYENQYYSHNDIEVNEIKRNKTLMSVPS